MISRLPTMTARSQYRFAYGWLRRANKRPDSVDALTLPDLSRAAWDAAVQAAFFRSEGPHSIMRWMPEGRTRENIRAQIFHLRYVARGRPSRPLPRDPARAR